MSLLLDALKQAEANKKKADSPVDAVAMPVNLSELALEENQAPPVVTIDEPVTSQDESQVEMKKTEPSGAEPLEPVADKPTIAAKKQPPVDVFSIGKKPMQKTAYKKLGVVLLVLLVVAVISLFLLPQEEVAGISYKDQVAAQRQAEAEKREINKAAEVAPAAVDSIHATNKLKLVEQMVLPSRKTEEPSPLNETIENPAAIIIKRKRMPSTVLSQLNEAYDALLGNDLLQAERVYKRVLKQRPKQLDALLGLANIESQRGFSSSARELYEKVLRIDETNSIAQIGLLQTYDQQDAMSRQQVLAELISKYESNPEAHLALAHALAEQSKWKAAQASYFKAFSLSPNNTVYAYNLAVSLDRLEQYPSAVTYYKKTLSLNKLAAKPLSLARVRNRLIELEKSNE